MAHGATPPPSLSGDPPPYHLAAPAPAPVPLLPAADCDVSFPVDLLLEIAARADVVAVVRFAATSKPLRRAILDRGFRRLLAVRAAAIGGFDPSLLRAISFKVEDTTGTVRVVQPLPSTDPLLARFDVSLSLEPVASLDGLVILRRLRPRLIFGQMVEEGPPGSELHTCNSITGHTSTLPSVVIRDYNKHALLTVSDHGRSFELLVADETLRTQTYSSRDGRWSVVRRPRLQKPSRPFYGSCPLVIGRVVHWLCCPNPLPPGRHLSGPEPYIVALHADTAEATVIELPQGCTSRMTASMSPRALMLASSADGRLSVVVSESQKISMWTLSTSIEGELSSMLRWSRQVLIDKQHWGVHSSVQFEGFGLKSGTALLYIGRVGLVRLNLGTKEAFVVHQSNDTTHISQVVRPIDVNVLLISQGMCATLTLLSGQAQISVSVEYFALDLLAGKEGFRTFQGLIAIHSWQEILLKQQD